MARPRGFTYSTQTIRYAIGMVIFGSSSLRGAAFNLGYLSHVLKKGLPCWTVIQNWVLRYGLYRLLTPLPKRDDWILVLDHTIEFGTTVCLVILAVKRAAFLQRHCQLRHKDMQVAAIHTRQCSTGEDISQILTELSEQMGCPAQIVSDAGSNLAAGIRKFIQTPDAVDSPQKTIWTYDITHKAAILLKHLLQEDPAWNAFTQDLAKTKRRVVHTDFVAYAPNKPRDKARWLNLEQQVKWAENILATKGQHGHPTKAQMLAAGKFQEYFGWVKQYKRKITVWRAYLDVLTIAQKEVKQHGLSTKTAQRFERQVKQVKSKRKKVLALTAELLEFFRNATSDFTPDTAWLGSSDIIESVLGKYKTFSSRTPMKEVGKAILTIPAFTSELTSHEVTKAMENVSDKELSKWLADNLGESLLAKRRKAFSDKKQKTA